MKWMIVPALVALAAPLCAHAATCRLTQLSAVATTAVYDPFDVSFAPAAVAVNVQTTGCRSARIQFALAPTPSTPQTGSQVNLSAPGSRLVASIENSNGQIQTVSNPVSAFQPNPPFFALTTTGALANTAPLQLAIQPGQPVPPSVYLANLFLLARVTDGDGTVTQVSSTSLSFAAIVKPSVRLAAGVGGLDIDLGELSPGEIGGPVGFGAYANVDYTIRLISDNGFRLEPSGHGSPAEGVPYATMISNQTAPDTGNGQGGESVRSLDFNVPGGNGMRQQTLQVKVLPYSGLPAANYSDLLTLEIRARV